MSEFLKVDDCLDIELIKYCLDNTSTENVSEKTIKVYDHDDIRYYPEFLTIKYNFIKGWIYAGKEVCLCVDDTIK